MGQRILLNIQLLSNTLNYLFGLLWTISVWKRSTNKMTIYGQLNFLELPYLRLTATVV